MNRVLLIDNLDSFAFNVVQGLRAAGAEVIARRADAVDVAAAVALDPTHLVISPGPGRPEEAGASIDLIHRFLRTIPVLGVCLGHQALAVACGAVVRPASALFHGETSPILHEGTHLFAGLSNPLTVGRYHSLAVDPRTLPPDVVVAAQTADGEVMALRHRDLPVYGVQFHPESVLTPEGPAILEAFLRSGSALRGAA